MPGTRAEILGWLEAQGVRAADAVPPKDAGKDATVAAIQYSDDTYRVGPDGTDVARLLAIRDALGAGDAAALRALCDAEPIEKLPLALGVIRAAEGDAHERAIVDLAKAVLAEPMRPRTKPKAMSLDEEVLRRAAALADEETFGACVERLDAIERDAEKQSDWAMPGGLRLLAYACAQRDPKRAFECYRRLAMRAQPHWQNVNMALAMLAKSTARGSALDGPAEELIRTTEGVLKEYGADARDALLYNLACVYARAGRVGDALSALRRCKKIRKQNPSPETDEDLEALWANAEFRELLGAAAPAPSGDEEDEDEDEDESDYRPPRDRAVPRQRIRLRKGGDPKARQSRIGGLPNASDGVEWPDGYNRPMRFVLQLVGTKAGGEVDLGDVSVLSVFADLDGDYYEASCQKVILQRGRCDAVLEPPVGVETDAVRLLALEPGHDDRILLDIDWLEEGESQYEEWEAARKHAFEDKLWGIPVGANVDPNHRDAQGRPMKCLLQLVSYDDWFLWYLFVSEDFSEARLQVVRG